jgi:hypothetical protein
MDPDSLLLLPRPRSLTLTGATFSLDHERLIALDVDHPAKLRFAATRAQSALADHAGVNWHIVGGAAVPAEQIGLHLAFDPAIEHAQGYRLTIDRDRIHITAQNRTGIFYGITTLVQIIMQHGEQLPGLTIDDQPDLNRRGVMIDISRDRVPGHDTLYALVDLLASWKVNEFQLYSQHVFAYRHHPDVWANASPLTAEEIMALDAYCRERHIDLVPNQNSFGHLHRFFKHPQYLPLAETEPFDYRDGDIPSPFTLTPTNPDSIRFVAGLYAELLPNFTSRYFNAGCDEAFDLGTDRTKTWVEEKGKGRVYLDFLLQIYEEVKKHDRVMMFWGDIINEYPELVPELPRDMIALEWGYEDDHDFAGRCANFAQTGIPFYVCPGTSAWNTFAGRTDNCIGNIRNAVENGLAQGAVGLLNTDWGDHGRLQPWTVSYLGYAYGAAASWSYTANRDIDLPAVLDRFAFRDRAGVMGKLAYDLGNAYQQTGLLVWNNSMLFLPYLHTLAEIRQEAYQQLDDETLRANLHRTLDYIDTVMASLEQSAMRRSDADLIKREFMLAANMMRQGARYALLELDDPAVTRNDLRRDLDEIRAEYRRQWFLRSRPGDIEASIERFDRAQARLLD